MDDIGPIGQWRQWWIDAGSRDPLAPLASERGFVLTTARLAELGITRSRARWAVRRGEWTRAGRGMVSPVDVRTALPEIGSGHVLARRRHALLGAGAAVARPADAVSGRTAAIMHGLPTLAVPPVPELNARVESGMGLRSAALLRAGTLDAWQMTTWYGIDVSDVARTLVDVARRNRRDAIMAVDAALREQAVTRDEIERAITLAGRWPGIRRAREVLGLADGRAESPLESLTRLALHDAGLPAPELQVWIGRDRVDFYWRRFRFVLEADGRLKYTADERWEEKKREQRLRMHGGNRVERVTWSDVMVRWPETRSMLASALR